MRGTTVLAGIFGLAVALSILAQNQNMRSRYQKCDTCEDVRQTVRAFLSYQTKDKVVAGNVRAFLEKVGIQSFLAHGNRDLRGRAQPFADEMRSLAFGWFASLLGQYEGTLGEFFPAPIQSKESSLIDLQFQLVNTGCQSP